MTSKKETRVCSCILCKSIISYKNIGKHYNSKLCQQGRKHNHSGVDVCPYCDVSLPDKSKRAGHIKWCKMNPKRDEYLQHSKKLNQFQTDESRNKTVEGIKKAHAEGRYKTEVRKNTIRRGWKHTDEAKERIRQKALANNYQRKSKKSHSFTDKSGRVFIFDSTWEDALATRLDELCIEWTRPDRIPYIDLTGKQRHYYPDFYLPVYDVYLDPKNQYCVKEQSEKINILKKMIRLIIITSLEDCKNFCTSMIV